MDMSEDERLKALESLIDGLDSPNIGSAEELARSEGARAARHFGFTQPQYRTSVKLRFTGEGVRGHDLSSGTAAGVLNGFTGAIDAVRLEKRLPPGSADLFLSPTVHAGSTILELYGAVKPTPERLDIEIDDTPVDAAIARLFEVLDHPVQGEEWVEAESVEIEALLGKKLYSLSKSLIDGSVDLELLWTKPRGSTRSISFHRSSARALRSYLDRVTVTKASWVAVGTLETISTSGLIDFRDDSGSLVSIEVADAESTEILRSLWAQEVLISWAEVTTRHPMRDDTKISRSLNWIAPAGAPARDFSDFGKAIISGLDIYTGPTTKLPIIRLENLAAIRTWARENNIQVSNRGRIPNDVVASYLRDRKQASAGALRSR